ncbi:MAG: hypothetical protein AAFZ38_05530 [Myxococcota bacterium]
MNDRHIENALRRQRDRVLSRVLGVGAWFTMLLLTGCSLPQFELVVELVVPEEVQNELAHQFPLALYVVGPLHESVLAELCEPGEDLIIVDEHFQDCDGGLTELEYFLAPIELGVAPDCGELEHSALVSAPAEEFRVGPSARLEFDVEMGFSKCDPEVIYAEVRLE